MPQPVAVYLDRYMTCYGGGLRLHRLRFEGRCIAGRLQWGNGAVVKGICGCYGLFPGYIPDYSSGQTAFVAVWYGSV